MRMFRVAIKNKLRTSSSIMQSGLGENFQIRIFEGFSDMSSSLKMYNPVVLSDRGSTMLFFLFLSTLSYLYQNWLASFDWFRYSKIFLWNVNFDSLIRFCRNIFFSLRYCRFAGVCLFCINWVFLAPF